MFKFILILLSESDIIDKKVESLMTEVKKESNNYNKLEKIKINLILF